jgi:hypothetical protein
VPSIDTQCADFLLVTARVYSSVWRRPFQPAIQRRSLSGVLYHATILSSESEEEAEAFAQTDRARLTRHQWDVIEPVTSRDIALVVMKARGLNPDNAELSVTIRKRIGARNHG